MMKKKLTLLCLCTVILSSTLSCGTMPTNGDLSTAEPGNAVTESAFDADSAYADILTECHALLSAPSDNAEYPDTLTGIYEAAMSFGADALNTIGYVFRDLNEDTIPELLIGAFDKSDDAYTKNEIYAAYTYDGQNPVPLFSGWARNAYALTEDNTFFHHGSGGAAYAIFGEYTLSDAGEFICMNSYFTYPKDDEMTEIGYYRNTSGVMDPAQAEEWAVNADEFWAVGDALAAKTVVLTVTPFSAYSK